MLSLTIESSLLEPLQLQREPGPQLLQINSLSVLEDITMSPEEDKVALVVQGSDLTTLEFGDVGEEGSEHSSDGVTETGVKVVEDQFWLVRGCASVSFDIFAELDRAQLEMCCGSVRQMNQRQRV